jgi:hypothetical protein
MSERENKSVLVRTANFSLRRVVRNMLRRGILALAALAALVFVSAGPTHAQAQSSASNSAPIAATIPVEVAATNLATVAQAATPKPPVEPIPSAAQSATRGAHEGIKVHGHWIIEVRNPDGKVASHTEFENALNAETAEPLLLALITGQTSPGAWAVGLEASGNLCGSGPAVTIGFAPGPSLTSIYPCVLTESGDQYFSTCNTSFGCSPTLTVTPPSTSLQAVTLTGQMTVVNTTIINAVSTMLMTCSSSVPSSACPTTTATPASPSMLPPSLVQLLDDDKVGTTLIAALFPFGVPFTRYTLATPTGGCGGTGQPVCQVPVTAQQTVAVTVQISFQ